MKYFVVEPFTLETQQGTATLSAGQVLELSQDQAARLGVKVELIPPANDGRDLEHYCKDQAAWCSSRLPAHMNPTPCRNCGGAA